MTEDNWVDVFAFAELEEDIPQGVFADDHYIVLYRIGEAVHATAGFCTHEVADLCDGYVDGDIVECPLHQARFHIPTGKVLSAPADRDLGTYRVDVREERVFVRIPS
ncbi:MAG: non-heme iron oxygenase ferredoxin subunit [Alphaproteobacteria bacterium]|nr:non-heme iron oxygenase ferredoxin subunit [Alphaproteobacteria bacterium]